MRDGLSALQDRNGTNTITNEYTWGLNLGGGIGGLLDLKQGGVHYSYCCDGKGNVEAVLDWERNMAAAYRYDPFGKVLAKIGALKQPFQFSTKRFDALTGLSYYGYRFYSTEPYRWTTRDPLGEAGGVHLYAFVGNNPVNWGDPNGEELVSLAAGAGFTVVGPAGLRLELLLPLWEGLLFMKEFSNLGWNPGEGRIDPLTKGNLELLGLMLLALRKRNMVLMDGSKRNGMRGMAPMLLQKSKVRMFTNTNLIHITPKANRPVKREELQKQEKKRIFVSHHDVCESQPQ